MYRRARPTLQDLMEFGGDGGGGGGMQSGIDPTQVGGSDSPLVQQLLAQAFAPQDLGPRPEVYKPKFGNKLAAALGDAFSAYGRAFAPIPATNYRGEQLGRKLESEDKQARYDAAKALSGSNSGREKARFQLGEISDKQARADAAKAKTELAAYQAQQKKDAIAQHAQDLADAEARDNRAAVRDAKIHSEFAKEREIHDAAQERLHEKQRQGDKIALRDEAKIDAVKEYIGTLADNLDEILKVKDPVAVMNSARRFMDRQSMSKDAREIVESYMRQEVTSRIVEQNDLALDAGSPQQQDPNAPMTSWQRNPSEAAGAVVGRVAQPFIDSAKGIGQTPAGSAIKRVWNRGIGN